MSRMTLDNLRVLRFTIDNIGPFRQGTQSVEFMGKSPGTGEQPEQLEPSNFYMLLSKNGYGKTTILECIHGLMGIIGSHEPRSFRYYGLDQDGRAQLDLRITWTIDETTQTVLLSLWSGDSEPLRPWSAAEIDEHAQASQWAKLGFERVGRSLQIASGSNELGRLLHDEVASKRGTPPTALYGLSSDLPCVIYFPANRALFAPSEPRAVVRPNAWGYEPAYRFEMDGPEWATSVDNLLVWLEWLNDERLGDLLKYVNENLFAEPGKTLRPPKREELAAFVSTATGDHPLSQLSHGERALLQFFARSLSHMTSNTIVLIEK
jgi:hypothetical protein